MMEARTLAQFAGYTSRVAELFEVLEDVNKGRYERTMVESSNQNANTNALVTNNVVTQEDLKGQIVIQDRVSFFIHSFIHSFIEFYVIDLFNVDLGYRIRSCANHHPKW